MIYTSSDCNFDYFVHLHSIIIIKLADKKTINIQPADSKLNLPIQPANISKYINAIWSWSETVCYSVSKYFELSLNDEWFLSKLIDG
jgi:hypothetical protein